MVIKNGWKYIPTIRRLLPQSHMEKHRTIVLLTGIIRLHGIHAVQLTLPAARLYLATRFVWGLLFYLMVTVSMVYQVEIVGLDPLQLVLVGTALEVSAFVFEVPTGIVADRYSRKLSIVTGYAITAAAFVLMALVPTFIALVTASFLWGLGWTFVSGAQQAWLADEIGEMNAAPLYLAGERLKNYGAFCGIVMAVLIGSFEIHYSILVAGLGFAAWSVALYVLMQESGFTPSVEAREAHFVQTLREGFSVIRRSQTLMLLMLVGVVFGTFSEGYDRLAAAHLLRGFSFEVSTGLTPVIAFGLMTAAGVLLSIVAVSYLERVVDTENARHLARVLSIITVSILIFVLVFALTGQVWLAIAMYIVLQPLRSVIDPLTMAWVNRNIASEVRATVISMHAQSDALGQMAGGPGMGLIGREVGVRIAISCAAVLLAPAVLLYERSRRFSTTQ